MSEIHMAASGPENERIEVRRRVGDIEVCQRIRPGVCTNSSRFFLRWAGLEIPGKGHSKYSYAVRHAKALRAAQTAILDS